MKLLRLKRPASGQQRRGATAVEFALVIPVFALFCVVLLDFSRLSLARSAVQNAVYRSARFAMTEGVTRQETIDSVNEYLEIFGFEAPESSIVVGQIYLNDEGLALPVDTISEFDSESVEFYVEVSLPFDNATLVFPTFFPDWVANRDIRSEIRVRSERYSGFFNPSEAYAN